MSEQFVKIHEKKSFKFQGPKKYTPQLNFV